VGSIERPPGTVRGVGALCAHVEGRGALGRGQSLQDFAGGQL
jgi:hypothetical protein